MNTEKIELSELTRRRIRNLHDAKVQINSEKIKHLGNLNIDDHGFIHFPDFKFDPKIEDESGILYGMVNIGKTFRRLLNEMPRYIHPDSALATCWVGQFPARLGYGPADQPTHLQGVIDEYHILQPGNEGMNHLCPDMRIGLELGWGGILKKIRHYRQEINPADTSFFDGEEEFVLGVQEWVADYVRCARAMAEKETDEVRRANLLEIADMNEWLVENPPRTLREACQFLAHFQCVDRTYAAGGAMGPLDEYLRPFYERDVENGRVTDEEAVWYIASLFFNDTHYAQLGGLIPDGSRDVTSRMSFIILDAMHVLHIPANVALSVNDKMNEDLFDRALQYTLEDGSGVCYSLMGGNMRYAKNGYTLEQARMRVKSGCNWTAIPGYEYPLQDVTRCNMAVALTHALDDLNDDETLDLEKLWKRFFDHLKIMLDCIKDGYDWHYEHISNSRPEIVLNLFMHGPIERGLNCAQGGVDLRSCCVDGIALATVADSFGALEERVIKEKRLSWQQVSEALQADFAPERYEKTRLLLKNIRRLGDPDSPSLKWAKRIRDAFVGYAKIPTPKHHLKIIPGMFSHGDVFMYGNVTPATPNGRRFRDPISHSNEPDDGFAIGLNTFSPTLKANTVAELQPGLGNSSPLHLDIDMALVEHGGGINALKALIRAHNAMGGTLINLNCLNKETLLAAHENPDAYPDLVVRVTGYSAFFASLSKEYRQQVVDRFLQ